MWTAAESIDDALQYNMSKQIIPVKYGAGDVTSQAGAPPEIAAVFPEIEGILKTIQYFARTRLESPRLTCWKCYDALAKMEAEARKQEEIAARKKLLLEQQEDERFRQKHIQRKEKLAEQKWDKQFDTLLAQIKDRRQKDDKLEEIRIIIQNREPSLQELDWDSWLSDPLNQKLADLDFDHAMEMFKRDNLMAKRRRIGERVARKIKNRS